jgi:hypothetical protein
VLIVIGLRSVLSGQAQQGFGTRPSINYRWLKF